MRNCTSSYTRWFPFQSKISRLVLKFLIVEVSLLLVLGLLWYKEGLNLPFARHFSVYFWDCSHRCSSCSFSFHLYFLLPLYFVLMLVQDEWWPRVKFSFCISCSCNFELLGRSALQFHLSTRRYKPLQFHLDLLYQWWTSRLLVIIYLRFYFQKKTYYSLFHFNISDTLEYCTKN